MRNDYKRNVEQIAQQNCGTNKRRETRFGGEKYCIRRSMRNKSSNTNGRHMREKNIGTGCGTNVGTLLTYSGTDLGIDGGTYLSNLMAEPIAEQMAEQMAQLRIHVVYNISRINGCGPEEK